MIPRPQAGRRARPGLTLPDGLRIERDPLRLSLFFLMIITVSRIHQHWKLLGRLRPALVLAALTGLYAYLNPRFIAPQGLLRTWPARVVAAIAVWACLSVPFGISLGGSAVFILEEFSKTLLFAFLLIVSVRRASDLYTFVWAYVISTGILAYFALFVFGISKKGGEAYRLSNLYTWDANDLGVIVLIGMALTLVTFQTAGKWGKVLSGAILLGIGATIARSGSRGAFLGVIVTAFALLVLVKSVPLPKKLAFVTAALVALAVWAPPGYWVQMKTIFNPKDDYNWSSQEGRKQVALRGMEYMFSRPIFGVGIHNFWRMECLEGEKVQRRKVGRGIRCTPPHNSYVEAGSELGIPGLLLWSGLIFGGIVAMIGLRQRLPAGWRTGDQEEQFLFRMTQYMIVALIGFAVTSFFLSFAWVDPVYILAAFMSGLYVSVEQKLRGGRSPVSVRKDPRMTVRGRQPLPPPAVPFPASFRAAPGNPISSEPST
jgi:O-antigen ligase